ncbi:hypothetical protein OCU04_000557 [Sclerotinia nivalis]|uniref:Methyltransferase domain-containing protein n=1 Tax=Sclerotinia nivalis TaxID=352851 RepID=A0A9X0AWV4_9HELO|nr:hypothetical protein OCU04_000557 [Sclerotinia nivalis]
MQLTMSDVSSLYESFNSEASTYERRLGGSTRRIIAYIISLLGELPDNPIFLDNACGPGFATEALLKAYPNCHVHAADIAPSMIALVNNNVILNNWADRVEIDIMDGINLSYPNNTFDVSITNFGISLFSDPIAGAKEIHRTLKPGGKAAITCWKDPPFSSLLHAVQSIIKPHTPPLIRPQLEQWSHPKTMHNMLLAAGFQHENIRIYEKEVMWWNRGVSEAARGFADHFFQVVGEEWGVCEKGRLCEVTERLLRERGREFVVDKEGMVGCRLVAWVAIAVK